jgi:rhodanese-related sulfurtransferase
MDRSARQSAAQMVAEARARVEGLTPEQVAAELKDSQLLLIDLRETEERAQSGWIPSALHAPRGMLEFWADPSSPYHRPEFDPSRRVILYCASGGRSALAADVLASLGYSNVAHLDRGFKAWEESGGAVDRTDS